jgi:hypothetical protein
VLNALYELSGRQSLLDLVLRQRSELFDGCGEHGVISYEI